MFKNDDDPAFAGQVSYSGRKSNDPIDRLASQTVSVKVHKNQLDQPQAVQLFNRLIGFYRRELMRQQVNRNEMATDADFYDGDQYTREDEATLRKRGQEPLVYNVIATTIDWLLGTEKRGRTDYKILPRTKEASRAAEIKTKLMKYLADVNRVEFDISRAFSDQVRVGVGWIEVGVQDDIDGEPIYERYESWRNMIWDSAATELDLKDARYMFRAKWMDLDEAVAMFPERKITLQKAASESHDLLRALSGHGDDAMDAQEEESQDGLSNLFSDPTTPDRQRVRMIEAWFTLPVEDQYIRGGEFNGELFDRVSPGHVHEIEMGRATVVRKVRKRMFAAIMTEAGLVHISRSPYRHNRYPFTPLWCYRRDRDGMPYGVVRKLRGPQMDINKRASKALYILSSNKTIMDRGAVKDINEFAEEVSRPDGIIVKEPGKHLEINADRELAAGHLTMMERSIMMIQQVGGVTDENMGRTTNATSGKAIERRQDQGALASATIFDNLRYSRQIHGEKKLSLMEQFMDQKKQFRITNMRGKPDYIDINDGSPETDIVQTKADFIIDEDDWNSTVREAQTAELMTLMQMLAGTQPQVVMMTLDLLIETMDVPQREEIVKRIRQITGAEDPDADPDNPDQDTINRKNAQEQEAQYKARLAAAELEDKEAGAAEKRARAEKASADSSRIQAEVERILAATRGENIQTQVSALAAAAQILGQPGLAQVADHLLTEVDAPPAAPQEALPQLPAPQNDQTSQVPATPETLQPQV